MSGIGKVPLKEKLGYGIGSIGKDMCYAVVGSFFMYYCTETLGVSALFMGLLFFFARLWDAFNDPMMGTIVDNTRNRFGRYRTWILVGSLINSVVLILLYYKPSFVAVGETSVYVYVAVMYVLWGMSYTLVDVPYWSFVSAITDDPSERDSVSTIPRLFAGLGNFSTQILTLGAFGFGGMVLLLGGNGVNKGYFKWAAVIAAVFVFFILITVFTIKERTIVKQDKKFSLGDAFRTLKNNDQLMVIVVVLIILNMAQNMALSVAIYYFKYVWGAPDLYGTFSTALGVSVAIGLVLYPFIAKKISRRKIFIASLILPMIAFVLMLIVSLSTGSAAPETRILMVAGSGLIFCTGFGAITVLTTVMLVDTVDYGEWKLGYRSESIIFSMQTFMVKFATALSGLTTGIGLSIAGFDIDKALSESALVGSFDKEVVRAAAQQSRAALDAAGNLESVGAALHIMMFIVPPILLFAALLIYVKKYKLNGKYLEDIQAQLAVTRAEKNAAD